MIKPLTERLAIAIDVNKTCVQDWNRVCIGLMTEAFEELKIKERIINEARTDYKHIPGLIELLEGK